MTRTLTLEGDITAVDTRTALTTQGSITAPSTVVPSGVSKIDRIILAAAADIGAAAGRASFFLRLGGPAILGGEQNIAFGASGGGTASAFPPGSFIAATTINNADINVSPSDTISVSAEMAGQDIGTVRIVVTLVWA